VGSNALSFFHPYPHALEQAEVKLFDLDDRGSARHLDGMLQRLADEVVLPARRSPLGSRVCDGRRGARKGTERHPRLGSFQPKIV